MILAVGTDIVEITRFQKALKNTPTLPQRLFTDTEQKKAKKLSLQKRIAHYAKRFAAKEAVAKACGTGIGSDIRWQDIEISNDLKGKPFVTLSKKTQIFLKKKFKTKKISIFLSLTDERKYAMAFVILVS